MLKWQNALRTGLLAGLLIQASMAQTLTPHPAPEGRLVQVVTFLDAGSDTIDVPAHEMTLLLLTETLQDPRFQVSVVPRGEATEKSEQQTPQILLTGFYRLREGKLLLDVAATLKTGKSMTRQFSEGRLEDVAKSLHELLQGAYCTLTIRSMPADALILIDGQPVGERTPAEVEGVLKGKHMLTLEADGYERHEKLLEIDGDATIEPELTAKAPTPGPTPEVQAAFGSVKFKKMPWAKIYVDGHHIGDTTTIRKIRLEVGTHEIRMVSPEAGTKVLNVEIHENETYAANF